MTPNRALEIVSQILRTRARIGMWPHPKSEHERKMIAEAFKMIRDQINSAPISARI